MELGNNQVTSEAVIRSNLIISNYMLTLPAQVKRCLQVVGMMDAG